jgi:hypothetical protein
MFERMASPSRPAATDAAGATDGVLGLTLEQLDAELVVSRVP